MRKLILTALTLMLAVPQAQAASSPNGFAALSVGSAGLDALLGGVITRGNWGTFGGQLSLETPYTVFPLQGIGAGIYYRNALSDRLEAQLGGGLTFRKFDPLILDGYLETAIIVNFDPIHLRGGWRTYPSSGDNRFSIGLELQTPMPETDDEIPSLF